MAPLALQKILGRVGARITLSSTDHFFSPNESRRGNGFPSAAAFFCQIIVLFLVIPTLRGAEPRSGGDIARLVAKKKGDGIQFFFENPLAVEVTATVDVGATHLLSDVRFPLTTTLPPRGRLAAFHLQPDGKGRWHFSVTNHFMMGSREARHDDSTKYRLPYGSGTAYRVSQGYGGTFSHQGPDRYSIDWAMPEGTPVQAARGGVVIAVKEDSHSGGPSVRWENEANYVLILHDDGTIGSYSHLKPNGSVVNVGQRVSTGQLIAYSGNTGFSDGPHLHFCVYKPKTGKARESIPIRFLTEEGLLDKLQEGERYRNPVSLKKSR